MFGDFQGLGTQLFEGRGRSEALRSSARLSVFGACCLSETTGGFN